MASLGAYAIFGINIIVCKDITNLQLVSPIGLFCYRAVGATILFWLTSLLLPNEKVEMRDLPKIFAASMCGLFLTQMTFLVGITMVSPLDCSIINALTPIFTMFVAAVAIKEPITLKKAGGVAMSFCGVIFLLLNSAAHNTATSYATNIWGVVLLLLNSFIFAFYLGTFRPLIAKYNVVTFMKWMFLFSATVSLPFGAKDIITADYSAMPAEYLIELGFLIFFSTFVAYFLVPVGQKKLRPTLVSLYSYVQPIIAIIVSIYIGMDTLTWQKAIAAAAVFGGVMLVNKSRSRAE